MRVATVLGLSVGFFDIRVVRFIIREDAFTNKHAKLKSKRHDI